MPYEKGKFGRHALEIDRVFYARWNDLRQRIRRNPLYKNVKCLRKNFEEFYDDMYNDYIYHYNKHGRDETTLDRIDVNGDYSKENCRRATRLQQSQNRNYNNNYTIKGETYCITERMRKIGIGFVAFKNKRKLLQDGLITEDEMLDKNFKPTVSRYYDIGNHRYSTAELEIKIGLSRSGIASRYERLKEGIISEEEFFAPSGKWGITNQMKILFMGKEYLISDIVKMSHKSRGAVSNYYNKLKKGEISEADFKNKFNIL